MLAQVSLSREQKLQSMQERFSREDPGAGMSIMMLLMTAALIFGVIWLLHRLQQRRREHRDCSAHTLYRRVLRQLDLPMLDRWRLWRLARVIGLEHPSAMLISPKVYDAACHRYCKTSGTLGSRTAAAAPLAAIRQRLFIPSDE